MALRELRWCWLLVLVICLVALPAAAQSSIRVQCPVSTAKHPTAYDPAIKCIHLSAGDGFISMAGRPTPFYIFGFSDLGNIPYDRATGLIDPGAVMTQGALAANFSAPTISVDEDDELFLNLTNVGMVMRPDLFDPHSVHWHGFPNASAFHDGVPESSAVINQGATFTYYYNAVDAGTYMYHCHVEAAEHMQMGMLGNLFVRPRQNRLPAGTNLNGFVHQTGYKYAYNDGDGSTRYDVEYPIQLTSMDPVFHDLHQNVQPLPFADMKDTYFMLNGRGYPDTVNPNVIYTDGRPSQPLSALITAAPGQRVLLRISNLSITRFGTLATIGIPMQVIALDGRLLQDQLGNKLYYTTNSVTLGGGQSADVILDTTGLSGTYFLYSANLDQLSNDAENFGGAMTEIRIN
ncbi:MAG: multicopper oxidase domain-containing protein [Terriglobales bacterium]